MKWYGNGKERTDGIFEGRGWRGCDRDCADPGGNIPPYFVMDIVCIK